MLIRALVFCLLAWFFTALLGGIQQAAQLSAEAIILPQWGPGLAALLMLALFHRDRLRISVFDPEIRASRYLLAAIIPIAGAALVLLAHRLLVAPPDEATTATPWILLVWFPLGAIGEELGWRGYLHRRLSAGLAGVTSSRVVGTMWAFWHVAMYQNGAASVAFLVLLTVSYSYVLYALMVEIGFNVVVASLFHMVVNVANLLAYPFVNQLEYMIISACVWAAIALVVVRTRKPVFAARHAAS